MERELYVCYGLISLPSFVSAAAAGGEFFVMHKYFHVIPPPFISDGDWDFLPSLLVVRLLRLCKYIHTFLNFKTASTPTKHIRHVGPCSHPCPRRGFQGSLHFPEKLDREQSLIDSSFYRRNSNLSSSKSMSLSTSDNGGIHARYLPYIIGKPRPSSKLPSTSSPTPVSPSRKKIDLRFTDCPFPGWNTYVDIQYLHAREQ